MSRSFVHLHTHTEYSMLDGASRISELVASAVADGQPAIGITDHGNMYGVLPLYEACREAGITPVLGMEAYFTTGDRRERPKRADNDIFHLTLLAESTLGYHNLIRVSSGAYIDGFHYKPRADFELLQNHGQGLIGTTGCLGSVICQRLLAGDRAGAREMVGQFQEVLGRGNFFIELQDHGLAEQHQVNRTLLELASELNVPLLATNDSHYTHRHEAESHAALLCVQTGTTLDDPNRFKFEGEEFYLKSAGEMRALFADRPDACDNTLQIAERAKVDIEFDNAVLPAFPTPQGHDEDSYLRELTYVGAKQRYGDELAMHVTERIDFELGVIKTMGFSAYFLVVWDLIRYAREHGIRVGPGRGSAAGSCVAYCLRIVDIDPIKYDLLFERFLNPGRKQMPDIDMDFDSRYRGDMIRYAAERYGEDRVAQIVTFSTIKARAAVRDAARVLGYPYGMGDRVAKLMPPLIMGRDTPLAACLELDHRYEDGFKMAAELRELYGADPDAQRVIDVARGLEGLRRQDGIHAAAVVITRDPLTEYLPIQRGRTPTAEAGAGPIVTQYEMHGVENLGLLKMDFLGLRNLDVLEITLNLIESNTGTRLDVDGIPLDDAKTFEMLCRGDSIGVFQLEGGPVRSLLRSLQPNRFEDIAALVALYRPGPMAQNWHNEYADRKNGRSPVSYPHEDLAEILEPTYGLMIYQEQLMRVAQRLAGYSLEEADNLRKATGKKDRALIAQERSKFVDGAERQGHARAFGEAIFDTIEPFADYSFNKSHSVGYGYLAYQTAYLKANYPIEYLAALLTTVKSNKDQTAVFLNECRQRDIPVLVPDVNDSEKDFTVSRSEEGKPAIRYGLSAVRNVGEGVVALFAAARTEGGPFVDFHDFCERVDPMALNKRTVESLVKSGAFDSLGHTRKGLLEVYEQIVDDAVSRRRQRDQGNFSFFDLEEGGLTDDAGGSLRNLPISSVEFPKDVRLSFEKEMLGLYVSDHPLLGAQRSLRTKVDCTIAELRERDPGEAGSGVRVVGGIVTGLARKYTKKGDLMATFVLEDLASVIEVMVFPRTMADYGHLLGSDAIVCVKGRLDTRDDDAKLIAMEITQPDIVLDDEASPFRISVKPSMLDERRIQRVRDILSAHPGDHPVLMHVAASAGATTVVQLADDYRVDAGTPLCGELRELLGADCLL